MPPLSLPGGIERVEPVGLGQTVERAARGDEQAGDDGAQVAKVERSGLV